MNVGNTPIISMKGIVKQFPGVRALSGVDLDLYPGEVHALVGENGAGKSTLIKIMMGVYQKTEGQMFINGQSVVVKSPQHAQELGLGAVYQDVNLAQDLSVAENFFMGSLPHRFGGVVDYAQMYRQTKSVLDSISVHVDPKAMIRTLSVAQQEMVAIGKIVHQRVKAVVFDEPTALLTGEETEELFRIIAQLKEAGVGIIYISHRMEEIFRICDRATILKDGHYVSTVDIADTNEDELISMMVGRDVGDMYNITHGCPSDELLRVEDLSSDRFSGVSFSVRKGEIFGMFGLVGSGRTEIVRTIFGADPLKGGNIFYEDQAFDPHSPSVAISKGIALLPEDRRAQGLMLGMSVGENINMVAVHNMSSFGVMNKGKCTSIAQDYVHRLAVKTPTVNQKVANLSGGNQQKVVIAKWLNQNSSLFIFDEPTVGVDVGAKKEIYKLFEELVQQGKTIIVISSYLPEVMGLSDRMLIMYEGRQMAILERKDYSDERIMRYASGIRD